MAGYKVQRKIESGGMIDIPLSAMYDAAGNNIQHYYAAKSELQNGVYPQMSVGQAAHLKRNELNSSNDLDSILDEGYYYWGSSQPANSPCTYATMEVRFASSNSWAKQIVYRQGSKSSGATAGQYTSEEIYMRSRDNNSGWTAWTLIPTVKYNDAHYLQSDGVLPVNGGGTGVKFANIATPGGLVTAPTKDGDTYHTKAWGTSDQFLRGDGVWGNFASVARHGATALTSQNLDSYRGDTALGWYYAGGGNTVQNKPSGVDAFGLEVVRIASGWYLQRLISNAGDVEYMRHYNASTWTAWVNVSLGAYPVGSIFVSYLSTSPAELIGGSWSAITDQPGEVSTLTTAVRNVSVASSQEKNLTLISIPANATALITGWVDSTVTDASTIMSASLSTSTLSIDNRTTMSNGGGCTVNLVLDPASTATTVTLKTYNYRGATTSFNGRLQALLIKKSTIYRWRRIA